MDNLISETNARLQEIIDNLTTIKNEYESKLEKNAKEIETELTKVKDYKEEFFTSKEKIDKMNSDIEGFEQDYQNLVDRFKDDELANILIAANKEISLKIDERKRKILNDKQAMNALVEKAEKVKKRLVKLTAEKKALELCLDKILDSYEYYTKELGRIIEYSNNNKDNLTSKENNVESVDIKLDDEDYNIESMKENTYDDANVEEVKEEDQTEDKEFVVDNTQDLEDDSVIELYENPACIQINDDEIEDEKQEEVVEKSIDDQPVLEPVVEEENEEPVLEDENVLVSEDKDDSDEMSMEKFLESNIEKDATDEIKLVSNEHEETRHVEEIPEIPSSIFDFDDIALVNDEIEDEQ